MLSCSAALELVAELAGGGANSGDGASSGSAAAALGALLEPQLRALLGARDAFLQCQALRVRSQAVPFLPRRIVWVPGVLYPMPVHDSNERDSIKLSQAHADHAWARSFSATTQEYDRLEVHPLQVSATLLAASLQPAAASAGHPNGLHINGHAAHAEQQPALLRALKGNIDPASTREVGPDVLEASLEAVGRLGASAGGAELLLAERSGAAADVAALALGRTGACL